jgi:ATP-binding cassette, subfamily B, bacterial
MKEPRSPGPRPPWPTDGAGSDNRLLRRILSEVRRYWPGILATLLLDLAATPLTLLAPVPLKIAVDSVVGHRQLPAFLAAVLPDQAQRSPGLLLVSVALLQVTVLFLTQAQGAAAEVVSTTVGERLTLSFRSRLFQHAQTLSLAFHDATGTADTIYRIQYDAPSLRYLIFGNGVSLLSACALLLSMAYVTARIDLTLALVALAVAPVLYVLSRSYNRRMRPRYSGVKQIESGALGVVQEVLGALRVVKAFGRHDRELDRFFSQSQAGARARIRLTAAEGWFGLLVNLATGIGTAVVLYVGILNVKSGILTLGDLLMVMAYLSQLYGPLETISKTVADVQSSLASAERAFELLGEQPEVIELPHAMALRRAYGQVEFREVWFSYRGSSRALQGVSFSVPAGMRVAISGPTGAGKSTLVSLLTRLYDPAWGQILLDGVDLRDYRLADLRAQFAIVLQDSVLFSTSVAENISYGRPEATYPEVVAAARAADVHDFIVSLPDGYDTLVGERGMRLSGGERQRIALARAFLRDAPILILDEPTSAVDLHTEASIMRALEHLMVGRTTFLITHRVTTLSRCDIHVEIEDGQVSCLRTDRPQPRRRPAAAPVWRLR